MTVTTSVPFNFGFHNHLRGHTPPQQLTGEQSEIKLDELISLVKCNHFDQNGNLKSLAIEDARINPTSKKVNETLCKISEHSRINLLHAIELKEKLKDTHYVFLHGQELGLSFIFTVLKEIHKEVYKNAVPLEKLKHRAVMRYNQQAFKTVGEFQATYLRTPRQVYFFESWRHRDKLLEADIDFTELREMSTAISCMDGNINNMNVEKNFGLEKFNEIFQHYVSDETAAKLAEKANKVLLQKRAEGSTGVLWTIVIPKATIRHSHKNFLWLANEAGTYSRKMTNELFIKTLDRMQEGNIKRHDPKACILTDALPEAPGVRMVDFCHLSKKQRRFYRKEARVIAKELIAHLPPSPLVSTDTTPQVSN